MPVINKKISQKEAVAEMVIRPVYGYLMYRGNQVIDEGKVHYKGLLVECPDVMYSHTYQLMPSEDIHRDRSKMAT